MEAAGIEPASRGVFTNASTCVADYLSFASVITNRQVLNATIPELCLALTVLGLNQSEPNLATNFWLSSAKNRSRGYLSLGGQLEITLSN